MRVQFTNQDEGENVTLNERTLSHTVADLIDDMDAAYVKIVTVDGNVLVWRVEE